jgi:hypothetical protein
MRSDGVEFIISDKHELLINGGIHIKQIAKILNYTISKYQIYLHKFDERTNVWKCERIPNKQPPNCRNINIGYIANHYFLIQSLEALKTLAIDDFQFFVSEDDRLLDNLHTDKPIHVIPFNKVAGKPIRYVLGIIDVYSRYVACRPLTNKNSTTLLNAIKECIQDLQNATGNTDAFPAHVNADNEFNKKIDIDYFTQNGAKLYFSSANQILTYHQGLQIIERFWRTLALWFSKMRQGIKNFNWVTALPDLIENYNTTTGFEFLKTRFQPGTFFRLWPDAPLADAIAMTATNVIDLFQAFCPQNHDRERKKSHTFAGFGQWQNAFPGYSFRYFTVTHELLLDQIGWPNGLNSKLCESFTPYLIGLKLDIAPISASSASSSAAGDAAEFEEEKEENEEESAQAISGKKHPLSPSSSQPPAKRREHCCRCSSGPCDNCRCARSRCNSSCQSRSCHFKSGVGAGAAVPGANDEDEYQMKKTD